MCGGRTSIRRRLGGRRGGTTGSRLTGGWRETLPGLGRGLQPVLMLLGAALFCTVAASAIPQFGAFVVTLVRGYPGGPGVGRPIDWAGNGTALASLAVAVVLAGWVGEWIGRR